MTFNLQFTDHMSARAGVDKNGPVVKSGDHVRLLDIRASILARLTGTERADVSLMLDLAR